MMRNQETLEDSTKCEEKMNVEIVPYLALDIIFNIFTRLPARKVYKLRYYCKEWYVLINSSRFVATHLSQTYLGLVAISTSMTFLSQKQKRYVHPDIIQIHDKKVKVRTLSIKWRKFVMSSCNGLVLLEDMEGRLSTCNPVTGQMRLLPPCIGGNKSPNVIRGITFVELTGEYKVISVVARHQTLRCEILALGSGTWKSVSSSFGCLYKWWLKKYGHECEAISIRGVLHFVLGGTFNDGEALMYLISIDTRVEKFYKAELPSYMRNSSINIHEIDGFPGVVVRNLQQEHVQWDVWVLKDLYSGKLQKQYGIALSADLTCNWHSSCSVVAILDNCRFLVFKERGKIGRKYNVYDVKLQNLRSLELDPYMSFIFRPHAESLVPC